MWVKNAYDAMDRVQKVSKDIFNLLQTLFHTNAPNQ